MEFTFNLIDQPWIPVIDLDERKQEKSLRKILTCSQEIRQISADLPHMNAAILRLLLVILYRSFTVNGPEDWQKLWDRKRFDETSLDNYFEKWRDRFDLFDIDHPFYQNRHPKAEMKAVNELLYQIAGGNHETLFDHNIEDRPIAISPKQAAQVLITAQAFSLGGLCNPSLKLVYTDAPCSRGSMFFLQGKNLFETLMLNLIPYNESTPIGWKKGAEDLPAWEIENVYESNRNVPNGYLDYFNLAKPADNVVPPFGNREDSNWSGHIRSGFDVEWRTNESNVSLSD
ncbi:MAG: type I-E CRISPR-associated protein Cse1/CasA [Flexilinea sp.]